MLSNSSKYAIKGVLYLAMNASEQNKILVRDLSEPINVPQAYMAKLLQELARHHIVSSAKGPKGGFYLNDDNLKTPLLRIVDVLDGDDRLRSCMLGLHECDDDNPCPIHHLVGDAKEKLIKNLEENTIHDLIREVREGKSAFPL